MSDNRLKFTKRALEALPPAPPGKRADYHDTETPGLVLRVGETGGKSFSLFRRIDGRPERVTIGRFPTMTVEQARNEVARLNGLVAKGANPAQQKRGVRQEITLADHFKQFMERHAKPYKKSWKNDQDNYDRYLSQWGNRKLSAIKKTDIQKLHAKIGAENGTYAANRMLATLSKAWSLAIEWGWDGANPCKGIKKFREQSRERFLQGDELPRFFQALADEPNALARDYFITSLLTGARAGNVKAMRWDQVNLERLTWTIPMTKNGTPQTLPLVPEMAVLLQRRKEEGEGGPFVFPGEGKSGHLEEPKKAWARILARAGIDDLRMHDLRRSMGSWQATTGANLSIIGKTLNHRNVSTTAIYARLNIDPVREAMEKATTAMLQAGGILESGKVVEIRRKQA